MSHGHGHCSCLTRCLIASATISLLWIIFFLFRVGITYLVLVLAVIGGLAPYAIDGGGFAKAESERRQIRLERKPLKS
jgi:hypothetical protein